MAQIVYDYCAIVLLLVVVVYLSVITVSHSCIPVSGKCNLLGSVVIYQRDHRLGLDEGYRPNYTCLQPIYILCVFLYIQIIYIMHVQLY